MKEKISMSWDTGRGQSSTYIPGIGLPFFTYSWNKSYIEIKVYLRSAGWVQLQKAVRAVLIEQCFPDFLPLFFFVRKTGNISKVWKLNRRQNIWNASHSNIWKKEKRKYANTKICVSKKIWKFRLKSPSIRTAFTLSHHLWRGNVQTGSSKQNQIWL